MLEVVDIGACLVLYMVFCAAEFSDESPSGPCHLECMHVYSVARSCPILQCYGPQPAKLLCYGIAQSRMLEQVAFLTPSHLEVGGQTSRPLEQLVPRSAAAPLVPGALAKPCCAGIWTLWPRHTPPLPLATSVNHGDRHGPGLVGAWRWAVSLQELRAETAASGWAIPAGWEVRVGAGRAGPGSQAEGGA